MIGLFRWVNWCCRILTVGIFSLWAQLFLWCICTICFIALQSLTCILYWFRLASDMLMLTNVLTVYISVLQLSYDLTWQKLKEKFSHCGRLFSQYELNLYCLIYTPLKDVSDISSWRVVEQECQNCRFNIHQQFVVSFSTAGQVMFAEIKMESGKSKGCGTVRFDSPESAEKACRMMNGTKINGREVDVRIDRNA